MVDKAFDEMGKKLNAGDPLFIRSSTKQGSNSPYRDVNGTYYWNNIYRLRSLDNIEVKLDADGNSEVRNIIKTLTGTSVSVGKKSDIKFGKISHIWGETSNPFFFTSLWNIVIVPAYYNDILDKDGSADPRIDMIIEQYKAVCWDRYDSISSSTGAMGSSSGYSRVVRGDPYFEKDVASVARRGNTFSHFRNEWDGFRVVRTCSN